VTSFTSASEESSVDSGAAGGSPDRRGSDPDQITFVSNLYPPETIGGAERHVQRIAERLADRGYDVAVLTTGNRGSYSRFSFTHSRQAGVDVYRFTPLNMYTPIDHQGAPGWQKPIHHAVDLWNPHVYRMLGGKLDELDPDVVHVHNFGGLSNAVFLAAAAPDRAVLHTLHDYSFVHVQASAFKDGEVDDPGPLMRPYQAFNRRTIEPYLDKVLAPSQFIIDTHRDEGVLTEIPCERLPLGVDQDCLAETVDKPDPRDVFRVLFAGQLTVLKGVDVLVDAVRQIEGLDLRLDVLGKGPERESLERRAAGDERIEFHGFVPDETLESFYERAHLTVVPSRWYDNSPMVIYESYAHGTPVLGAEIGGIPELIDEGETGYTVPTEDPAALAAQLRHTRADIDAETFDNARAKGDSLTLATHLESLLDHYRSVLAAPAGCPPTEGH
jgi:glycosyltransferase involved in cell wall biosynthesis